MADFMNNYSGLPKELLDLARSLDASGGIRPYSNPSCPNDTDGCEGDTPDCTQDSTCHRDSCFDTTCKTDSCASDGVCTDRPQVAKPTDSGSMSFVRKTSNSITVKLTRIARAEYYNVAIRLKTETGYVDFDTSSLTYTYTELSPNTTYVLNYRGVNSSGYGPFMPSGAGLEVTTSPGVQFDWHWAGLDIDGEPVAGDEKEAGLGVYVTAEEWNELVDLVTTATSKYVPTVSTGKVISASVVNSMARALGLGNIVTSEDPISASVFNALRDAYNDALE